MQISISLKTTSLNKLLFAFLPWQNYKRFPFWSPSRNGSYWLTKYVWYNWLQHFNFKIPFQGFTDETIKRYTSYLPKGKFIICIVNAYSDKASIICGVPQSSIFGPPQFLICLNDMTQAVHSGLVRWYTDDTCLVFQHKGTKLIDEPLNQDYSTLVDLFVDKERTFWWGRNKIHSLFSKTYIKINKTNRYLLQGHQNQTYSKVTYLGCVMGIYGNAGLHKNYLKPNLLYRISKVPFEGLKEAFV